MGGGGEKGGRRGKEEGKHVEGGGCGGGAGEHDIHNKTALHISLSFQYTIQSSITKSPITFRSSYST